MSRFVSSSSSAAAIAANPDYTYLLRQKRDQYLNSYPSGTLSGPVVKGHAWFVAGYSPQSFGTRRVSNFISSPSNANFSTGQFVPTPRLSSSGTPLPPLTYKSNQRNEYGFGRVDAAILRDLRGSVTYLWNPQITHGTLPFDSITTSNPVDIVYAGQTYTSDKYYRLTGGRPSATNLTGQLTYTPTAKIVGTFRYGRSFQNEKASNYGLENQVRYRCLGSQSAYSSIQTGCPGGINYQNISNNSITTRDVSIKNEYDGDVSYLPGGSFGGRHEFKGGYQHGQTVNDVLSGYAGTGIVALYYGQDYAQAGTGVSLPCALSSSSCLGVGTLTRFGAKGVGQNHYDGIYFQDKWQPSYRLTLNLGVRFEKEFLPSFNAGDILAGSAIPGIEIGWGRKIAPRLAAHST